MHGVALRPREVGHGCRQTERRPGTAEEVKVEARWCPLTLWACTALRSCGKSVCVRLPPLLLWRVWSGLPPRFAAVEAAAVTHFVRTTHNLRNRHQQTPTHNTRCPTFFQGENAAAFPSVFKSARETWPLWPCPVFRNTCNPGMGGQVYTCPCQAATSVGGGSGVFSLPNATHKPNLIAGLLNAYLGFGNLRYKWGSRSQPSDSASTVSV